jgi:hypothetical protein
MRPSMYNQAPRIRHLIKQEKSIRCNQACAIKFVHTLKNSSLRNSLFSTLDFLGGIYWVITSFMSRSACRTA